MAGQADGSIIVDTELNSDGFKAGSAELLAAIKSLSSEVKTLGQTLKETFSGNDKGVGQTDGKVQALEATISSLQAEVQSLKSTITELQEKLNSLNSTKSSGTPVEGISEAAQGANTQVTALEAKIKELEGIIAGMQAQLQAASSAPADIDFDTGEAEAKIAALESKVSELEATIAALQSGGTTATPTANFGNTTAGASSLQRQIEAVNSSVTRLEPTFQRAMGGSASAMSSFEAKAGTLEGRIASLKAELATMATAKVPTQEYTKLTAELQRTEQQFNSLLARQEKMQAMGIKMDSAQWKSLQYDMGIVSQKYHELIAAKQQFEASGMAFAMGADTAQYQHLNSLLAQASGRLAEMRSGLSTSEGFMSRLASSARSVFSWIGRAAKTVGGAMLSGIKAAASGMMKMVANSKAMKSTINGLTSAFGRLAPALLAARGLMGILRKAVNAYMQQNQQLAANLSACWSSIGNILGPIITRLISIIATAVAYLTQFLALLGFVGKSTSKAISSAGGGAKKETDKLKRQLASFDELNILSKDEEEEGGGGGGGAPTGETPDVTLPDWVALIAEHLKAGNWGAAATVLTTQLNNMVDSTDWAGIGNKLAYWIDGALEFLATAILTFDWFNLGTSLGTSINSILNNVDWGNLGVVLGAKFIALIGTLGGLFATIDWAALGKALADGIMGLWNAIDWGQAAATLSNGIIGALSALGNAIKNVDWQKLGNDIATFLASIDYSGVATALFNALGAALAGLGLFLWGLLEDAFAGIGSYFGAYIEEAKASGGSWVDGLLQGIWDGICNIGSWIYENVFQPFIDGFKSAFGINSPSKVMMEQGGFIVEGLLQGITSAWSAVTSFFGDALDSLISGISTCWSDIKSETAEVWSSIKTTVTDAWASLKTNASNAYTSVKNGVSTAWNSIKSTTSTIWSNIKSSVSSAWDNIKSNTSTSGSSISSTVSSKFSSVYSTISSKISSIKSTISSGFNSAKTSIETSLQSAMSTIGALDWHSVGSNVCTGIGNGINAGWNWLKSKVSSLAQSLLSAAKSALGIHSPSRLFRDAVGLNIGYGVGEGIEAAEGAVLDSVIGVADAIAHEFNANEYSIGSVVSNTDMDGALTAFSDKIADSFAGLMDRLQAIANSTSFTTPRAALGTVVPYTAQAEYNAKTDKEPDDVRALVEAIAAELIPAMMAGFEAVVSEQQSTREMISEIEVGDTVIGQAANRYNRKMAVVNGGT